MLSLGTWAPRPARSFPACTELQHLTPNVLTSLMNKLSARSRSGLMVLALLST